MNKDDVENGKKMEVEKKEAIKKVARLVTELIGDRTLRQTAEDSGVAASYLTGIRKERYLPSVEIFKKLTAPKANPQHGITLEDLMIAAGYQDEYQMTLYDFIDELKNEEETAKLKNKPKKEIKNVIDTMPGYNPNIHVNGFSIAGRKNNDMLVNEQERDEAAAAGIIYRSLAENRITFYPAYEIEGIRGIKPHIALNLSTDDSSSWWFFLFFQKIKEKNEDHKTPYSFNHVVISWFRQAISKMIFIEPKEGRKISLVTNNTDGFKYWISLKGKISFKGDLSVILVDMNSYRVLKEEYLSHYYDNEDSEFYII